MRRPVEALVIKNGKMVANTTTLHKIFSSGKYSVTTLEDYFLVTDLGRYAPDGMRFGCRNPLPLTEDLKLHNPIIFRPDEEVNQIFGIDFGGSGDPNVMLGEFDGTNWRHTIFIPADTYEAALNSSHLLIKLRWSKHSPRTPGYIADLIRPAYFCRIGNNDGLSGVEYWVLPFARTTCDEATLWTFKMRHAQMLICKAVAAVRLQRLAERLSITNNPPPKHF